jgi:hypothetical protein
MKDAAPPLILPGVFADRIGGSRTALVCFYAPRFKVLKTHGAVASCIISIDRDRGTRSGPVFVRRRGGLWLIVA